MANVQQDIYANTFLLWSEDHNDLLKKIKKWQDDCQEALEMVNILERFKPKMTAMGAQEYGKLKADIEKRIERILKTRQAKVEAVMYEFLSLQNSYFSTAYRLSENLQREQPSVSDIAARGTEYLGSLFTSWRDKIMPRQGSMQSDSSAGLYRSQSLPERIPEEPPVDPIFPGAVIHPSSPKTGRQPAKVSAYVPPSEVEDLFPGLTTYSKGSQKSTSEKKPSKKKDLGDGLDIFAGFSQNSDPLIQNNSSDANLYIDNVCLLPKEVQLSAGGAAVDCYFELNTPAFGDQISIDCISNLLELTPNAISVAKGATQSNKFQMRARPDAPCGYTGVRVLLSGNHVQNLRKFEHEILVEIVPPSRSEDPPKQPEIIVENIIPEMNEHHSDEEEDIFWDVGVKSAPVKQEVKPPSPAPAPAQQLDNDVFGLLSPSKPEPQPVDPTEPLIVFPPKDPNDLASFFGPTEVKKPKKIQLRRFEKGVIKSTGEGFREKDLKDVFELYRSPLHEERMNPKGFQKAWSHLCLVGDWRPSFKSAARPSHPNAVVQSDFCKIMNEQMRFQAENQVAAEVDRWEFEHGNDPKNRRQLLTLMQTMKGVLTYDTAGWEPPQLADMASAAKVRKIKRDLNRIVHPDRTKNLIYPDRARAERVYRALCEAFETYRLAHNM